MGVPCQPFGTVITALGSPLTFQEPVAAIKAFGKHSKLLCAPTPLKGDFVCIPPWSGMQPCGRGKPGQSQRRFSKQ